MPNEAAHPMRRTLFWACLAAAILSFFPFLIGSAMSARSGDWFAGFEHAFDDQMVYAAWMTQAQDGQFLMDNRFAVDPQPGLTVHVYFFALGLISKVFGIPLTMALSRALLAALFVLLLYNFLKRLSSDTYFLKLGLCLGVFGGGFGFAVWHNFGQEFTKGDYGPMKEILHGQLPIDVWQPEAFVFPSMLVNSLFVASLCLILVVFSCLLDARESWKPVPLGAAAMMVLMNIHSYDVLLIALVSAAFLTVQVFERSITWLWACRGICIALGAIPAAAWFVYVLNHDAVFQARAATPTYSPSFRQVLCGLLLLVPFAFIHWMNAMPEEVKRKRWTLGVAFTIIVLSLLFALGTSNGNEYWLSTALFGATFAAMAGLAVLLSRENPALNLVQCWALVGIVAIYFPELFQRKLAMGMALPWSILAALGIYALVRNKDKAVRTFGGAVVVSGLCLTSICWFIRERGYIASNVARTTVQPVFLQPEVKKILSVLREIPGRKVVIAMPGIALHAVNDLGIEPDAFAPPFLPDLNPLASGFSGAYTYAGHWSETPNYMARRAEATAIFLESTPPSVRDDILLKSRATHLIAPVPDAFPEFFQLTKKPLLDMRPFGKVLAGGTQFVLVELSRAGKATGN